MPYELITSFQNAKVKLARNLQDKKHREQERLFIIEYARDLERALLQGYAVHFALYCPQLASDEDKQLVAQIPERDVYQVPPDIMEKAAYRQNPSGLLAVMNCPPAKTITHLKDTQAHHLLVLVNLQKPGNIGALLRTADSAGFEAVLLVDTALDSYNPNIIRASTGASFLNNLYTAKTPEALAYLKASQYTLVAGHLAGSISLYQVNFQRPTALILGPEDTGLDDTWTQACDILAKIPMMGQLSDSLNVSVSGAIFMYEALRQRQLGDGH